MTPAAVESGLGAVQWAAVVDDAAAGLGHAVGADDVARDLGRAAGPRRGAPSGRRRYRCGPGRWRPARRAWPRPAAAASTASASKRGRTESDVPVTSARVTTDEPADMAEGQAGQPPVPIGIDVQPARRGPGRGVDRGMGQHDALGVTSGPTRRHDEGVARLDRATTGDGPAVADRVDHGPGSHLGDQAIAGRRGQPRIDRQHRVPGVPCPLEGVDEGPAPGHRQPHQLGHAAMLEAGPGRLVRPVGGAGRLRPVHDLVGRTGS